MVKRKNKARSKKSARKVDYTYAAPGNIRSTVGSVSASSLANKVEGLSNPWSQHARGSKIPDDDSSPSVPITMSYPKTFKTDANGYCAVVVIPCLNGLFKGATGTGGAIDGANQTVTTWNTSTDKMANYTEFAAAFHRFRIVSYGLRVYSTLAPTDQAGSYKIITLPETPGNGWSWAGGMFEDTVSLPLSEKNIHWIAKPIGVDYKGYSQPADTLFWNRCAIIVEGANGTADAVTVEIVLNLEATINIGSITSTMATPAEDHSPHVMAATSRVRTKYGKAHAHSNLMNDIKNFTLDSLRHVAVQSIPYVGQFINGMIGRKKNAGLKTIGN